MKSDKRILSHSPPVHSVGSYGPSTLKRSRIFESDRKEEYSLMPTENDKSAVLTGRLRSASFLYEDGIVTHAQKGVLKDLIITGGNASLDEALEKFESGDPKPIRKIVENGFLNRKSSLDLDDSLLNTTPFGSLEKHRTHSFSHGLMGYNNNEMFQMDEAFDMKYDSNSLTGLSNFESKKFGVSPSFLSSNLYKPEPEPISIHNDDDFNFAPMSFDEDESHIVKQMQALYKPNDLVRRESVPVVGGGQQFYFNTYRTIDPMELAGGRYGTSSILDDIDNEYNFLSSSIPERSPFVPPIDKILPSLDMLGPPRLPVPSSNEKSVNPSKSALSDVRRAENIAHNSNTSAPINISHTSVSSAVPYRNNNIPSSSYNNFNNANSYNHNNYSYSSSGSMSTPIHIPQRNASSSSLQNPRTKVVKYDVRKNFADRRVRVKGRFVKKGDEDMLRDIMNVS